MKLYFYYLFKSKPLFIVTTLSTSILVTIEKDEVLF